MRDWALAIGAIVVTRILALPRSSWEFDETLFFRGIHRYDPLSHFPPPPGYPLFMMVGKLVRKLAPDDFSALVAISFVASILGFVLLALAFGRIAGDARTGIVGALLFYFSPSMLLHSTLPISDPGGLALFAAALLLATLSGGPLPSAAPHAGEGPLRAAVLHTSPSIPILFGAFAAAAVGWRPQLSIAILPLLFVTIAMMRSWRDRLAALASFTVVCILWLIPLGVAAGSVKKLILYETRQAVYLAEHDADVSRSGWTMPRIAVRFIAHPWGPKLLAGPLLAAAAFGLYAIRKRREVIPLAASIAVYLGVALAVMDPADGARYALPIVLGVAFLAGAGVARVPFAYAAVAIFAAGAMVYTSSILQQRRKLDSPPVQAAVFAKAVMPQDAVVLYELPLWPHATYYLKDYRPRRVDAGLREYYDDPHIPLYLYVDGASRAPGALDFRWLPSDAYSKLTRNHYRVVSLVPLPPNRRFAPALGVYAPEREPEGLEWRWLAPRAELRLPPIPAKELHLRVGLPLLSPIESNELRVNGQPFVVKRGEAIDIRLPITSNAVHIEAAKSFVPARLPGSLNRDPRRLAVKLYDFEVR